MEAKYLVAIVVSLAVIALVTYSFFLSPESNKRPKEGVSWVVTVSYPINTTMKEGSGSIGLSSYAVTMTLTFFSGGKLNESSFLVGPLGTVPVGNVTIIFSLSNETSIKIFAPNSTVLIQGRNQEELFAATDRLILEVAGEYALDLDSARQYLIVVHPSKGHKVGLPWLGRIPTSVAKRVPIFVYGGRISSLRDLLLGPYSP